MQQRVFVMRGAGETRRLGVKIAQSVRRSGSRHHAVVVGLSGELGSGKTTFLQGFAKGLGVKNRIKSPTFLLMRSFPAKKGLELWHIDCYRIKNPQEIRKLGIEQIFKDPRHIVAAEWAERIKKLLPRNTIWIHFQYGGQPKERRIYISINL